MIKKTKWPAGRWIGQENEVNKKRRKGTPNINESNWIFLLCSNMPFVTAILLFLSFIYVFFFCIFSHYNYIIYCFCSLIFYFNSFKFVYIEIYIYSIYLNSYLRVRRPNNRDPEKITIHQITHMLGVLSWVRLQAIRIQDPSNEFLHPTPKNQQVIIIDLLYKEESCHFQVHFKIKLHSLSLHMYWLDRLLVNLTS